MSSNTMKRAAVAVLTSLGLLLMATGCNADRSGKTGGPSSETVAPGNPSHVPGSASGAPSTPRDETGSAAKTRHTAGSDAGEATGRPVAEAARRETVAADQEVHAQPVDSTKGVDGKRAPGATGATAVDQRAFLVKSAGPAGPGAGGPSSPGSGSPGPNSPGPDAASTRYAAPGRSAPATRKIAALQAGGGGLAVEHDDTAGERYAENAEKGFVLTADEATSTFAAEADTGAYSLIRRMLETGELPAKDLVRIEEMLNAFDYAYPAPAGDAADPFAIHTELGPCPWNTDARLLSIGLKGKTFDAEHTPPRNLVFLLDVSGSMASQDKLPLVQKALSMLTDQLQPKDKVSIVVYAGASGLVLPPTPGSDKLTIQRALNALRSGGSTNGGQGIQLAYDTAMRSFDLEGINRVVLCTDGDFNVGTTDITALQTLIEEKRQSGVFLTVLGVGRGNIKDDTMEMLARKGNGHYAYLDSEKEAKRVLVHEAGGTLVTIAKDVKIQVEFDPAQVSSYRLIGYANRRLANQDFADDTKDAGELGAGHTVTALYEIIPADGFADPTASDAPCAQVRLRYKEPDLDTSKLLTRVVDARTGADHPASSQALEWATAVATFGLVLRDSQYKGKASLELARELAQGAIGLDPFGHRAEFVTLIDKAIRLKAQAATGVDNTR